jgi:two-component system response regulator AlgR
MTEKLRALIVDDEPLAIERLQIFCARIDGLDLAGTASDGAAALRLVEALQPDLLLLDIAMPGLDGMAVAQALASQPAPPLVVFVTAFNQFAVAAFDIAAVDYLLKPVAQDRLERAIARVRGKASAPRQVAQGAWIQEFWVPHRDEIIRIAAREIDLIEAERDYMRLHVGPRSYLLHHTIGELERKLDPNMFVRLHRSTIARRDNIAGFRSEGDGAWRAALKDGRTVRIGRSYLASAREMAGR